MKNNLILVLLISLLSNTLRAQNLNVTQGVIGEEANHRDNVMTVNQIGGGTSFIRNYNGLNSIMNLNQQSYGNNDNQMVLNQQGSSNIMTANQSGVTNYTNLVQYNGVPGAIANNGLYVTLTQDGASGYIGGLQQTNTSDAGNGGSDASITQSGSFGLTYFKQIGNGVGHNLTINQTISTYSAYIFVNQEKSANNANITQTFGTGNVVTLTQTGALSTDGSNDATISQNGDFSLANVYQYGKSNKATVTQKGRNGTYDILQLGNNNTLTASNDGVYGGRYQSGGPLNQIGNNNTATLSQKSVSGSTPVTLLDQRGNGNMATISQGML